MIRALVWVPIAAAVVLATRVTVYALTPSEGQLILQLEHKTGPPQVIGAFAGLAIFVGVLAVAALGLVVVAVRERLALETRELVEAPRLRPLRLAARVLALFACTSVAFAYFESYIHWREGLGWHGLHCLTGPVHRDAIPLLAALSLLAVALHGAVEHLVAWTRRLVVLLAPRLPLVRGLVPPFSSTACPRPAQMVAVPDARGPPAGAFA
jgi:hypothetical protein